MKISNSLFGEIEVNQDLDQLFQTSAKPIIVPKVQEEIEQPEESAKEISDDDDASEQNSMEEEEQNEEKSKESKEKPKETNEGKKTRKQQKEELIDKNLRTVFVGNVNTLVVEKQNTKEFKKLFQEFGKLESIRFRSIAFETHMPRKEAYLQKKFHDKRDTLNAYVVFEKKEDAEKSLELNGHVFMEKHLRVDKTETNQEKKRDSKRCIFVGNLNFDLSEEALWKVFGDLGIEYVRLIRDRKTNVGKGFGYVQFKERSSVSLALKLNGTDVEGRPVRVTRATEQLADKAKLERKKVYEGARASRDTHGLKVKSKGSKVSKNKKVSKKK